MISSINKILFLDIETVPNVYSFDELDERGKLLWEKKSQYLQINDTSPQEVYQQKAAIFAEFSKVICIGIGIIQIKEDGNKLYVKLLSNDNEEELLSSLTHLLEMQFSDYFLCAHNGKEFDFPFLARRMLINNMNIPKALDSRGKKPWEISHIDTMELWKFGDYKHFTSLDLMTYIFNIPSPKENISGEDVASFYYEKKDKEKIFKYCQKDIVALVQIYLKMIKEPLIKEQNIFFK